MKFFEVPFTSLLISLSIIIVLSVLFFYPAISDFGHTLLGKDDIKFFIWLFWHYENSLDNGTNLLVANEIFYPYGISLSISTITPINAIIYLLLPKTISVFGKITILQILPFLLGGIFSFILAYRFTKSFFPSMMASLIYNFSVSHFEKALHYLNYNMAMGWLPLFFIFYFEFVGAKHKKPEQYIFLSATLLILALSELTVAIMLGFIVFLDIFIRYLNRSSLSLWTPKNTIILAVAVVSSLILYEFLSFSSFPIYLTYILPSILFFIACFIIIGQKHLSEMEIKFNYFKVMLLISLPTILYLVILCLQPTYAFHSESVLVNIIRYTVPLDSFIMSDSQAIFHLDFFKNLNNVWTPEMPIPDPYGLLLLVLLWLAGPLLFPLLSMLLPKASKFEIYTRDFSFLCIFFSLPLISIGSSFLLVTPFISFQLFPLLPVLRVSSRFMLFGFLFLSLLSAMVLKRLELKRSILVPILFVLVLVQLWPAPAQFIFDTKVPNFYLALANDSANKTIILYPVLDYFSLLDESYYQTYHKKPISIGTVSRFPTATNDIFELYTKDYSSNHTIEEIAIHIHQLVLNYGYDYLVVHKLHCCEDCNCPIGSLVPLDSKKLEEINVSLNNEFGYAIYEDDVIIVYSTAANK
ncbi:MAG: hypothetical protein ABH842_01165 [Candidatus Micrarchaeota archaeon]